MDRKEMLELILKLASVCVKYPTCDGCPINPVNHGNCELTQMNYQPKEVVEEITKELNAYIEMSKPKIYAGQYMDMGITPNYDTEPYPCEAEQPALTGVKIEVSVPDNVNHPKHYETGKFECIDVMIETQGVEAVKSFCICNAFKYLYRHKNKNGVEDVQKAIWYLNKFVELNTPQGIVEE